MVIALTVVGAVIRLWSPSRLGLSILMKGSTRLQGSGPFTARIGRHRPDRHLLRPRRGFPVLVGLSYLMLGVSDLAAILVSTCAGTLTIPVVGLAGPPNIMGREQGGPPRLSRPFRARMSPFRGWRSPTRSFLLFWLVAIGLGQRFLERPNLARALLLGSAVGLAQLFKYNGWIAGAVILLCAAVDWAWRRSRGRSPVDGGHLGVGPRGRAGRGRPLLALVFVRRRSWRLRGLLAHQRSYLGGLSSWPGHFWVQLGQSEFLSGGPLWLAATGVIAAVVTAVSKGNLTHGSLFRPRGLLQLSALAAVCVIPGFSWWLAPIWNLRRFVRRTGPETRSGRATLDRLGDPPGLDSFLSSLRQALATARGVRLAHDGMRLRRAPIQRRIGRTKCNVDVAHRRRIRFPGLPCSAIVFGAITLGMPVEQSTHELAGTERLTEDGGAIRPERVAQRNERTCAFTPARPLYFTCA